MGWSLVIPTKIVLGVSRGQMNEYCSMDGCFYEYCSRDGCFYDYCSRDGCFYDYFSRDGCFYEYCSRDGRSQRLLFTGFKKWMVVFLNDQEIF